MLLSLLVFIGLVVAVFHFSFSLRGGSVLVVLGAFLLTGRSEGMWLVLIPVALFLVVLNYPQWRRRFVVAPVYARLQKSLPPMSTTEREALEAGTTWWEKDLFSGAPDWEKFDGINLPELTAAEQSFIDTEVEVLCGLIDDWDVQQRGDLSAETWQYLREHGFFGLIIPEEFGGRHFSAYAQSRIMSKIASRSTTAAVTAMVPNSLGPGELLVKYGTDEQKQRWLPGLAAGSELPCFGLTGPEVGSDAGAIPDIGTVCMGTLEGEEDEVLGLNLTFDKRWITLAPVATVVGLAFQLRDPEGLLGDSSTVDYGITCALLPADHPGITIGRRHNPGVPFMNGPITGENVFIPVDWIIGGPQMAGKGWRMLIECLGAGRGVSLPALATASAEKCYVTVGAYARIRRQFNMEIGKFEGVQEATAEIAAGAYTLEAMRQLVTRGLEEGAPGVLTAMAKYHTTERMRSIVNHSMDVVSGRAIQMGPRNFIASSYHALPVGITVEGANILTRSLIIFGQGALRCHPFLFEEMQTLQDNEGGENAFEPLFLKHLHHVGSNVARLIVYGLSGSRTSSVPSGASLFSKRWYQRINQLSASLALSADVALGLLGGDLKRRELLSARLGDVHSELVIACSILKYHDSNPASDAASAHAHYAVRQSLNSAQQALDAFFSNFPQRSLGKVLRLICLPLGSRVERPDDQQIRDLGGLIMQPNPVRAAMAQLIYMNTEPDDSTGRLESTYQMLLEVDSSWQAFTRARRKGELMGETLESALSEAVAKGIISAQDVQALALYNERRFDCLLTDTFEALP